LLVCVTVQLLDEAIFDVMLDGLLCWAAGAVWEEEQSGDRLVKCRNHSGPQLSGQWMLTLARDWPLCAHKMAAQLLCAVAAHLGVHAVSVLLASQVRVTGHICGRTAALVVHQV
jgi:hypothetical protein